MNKIILAIGIVLLFILSSITPISLGVNSTLENKNESQSSVTKSEHIWPMYKHDAQRTGRSPYDTSDNPGIEKWKYYIPNLGSTNGIVIDKDEIIYGCSNGNVVFAVYPNGTEKWTMQLPTDFPHELAIGPEGNIYTGTTSNFYALYSNNGTLRWKLKGVGSHNYISSPVIDSNGTVYVGTADGYLFAVYPNGTVKWDYKIDGWVSAPAVDKNGNIYFASRNRRVYCLNPNGTLKWRETITVFDNGPVIGDDGHIYLGPRTDWTYAYFPNGTEKWRTDIPDSEGMPSIAPNGNIIVPGRHYFIMALNPSDGNFLWKYPINDNYNRISQCAISADGTIYFSYTDNDQIGQMYAVNSDGTLKWNTEHTSDYLPYGSKTTDGAPAIGADGTVYIASTYMGGIQDNRIFGYVHAFGKLDADAPSEPEISGPSKGKRRTEYEYTFKSTSPLGNDVYYLIFWGDDSVEQWIGPFSSGEEVVLSHSWEKWGKYTIKARAKDSENLWSPWGTLEVTMPRNKETSYSFFLQFFERFPLLKWLFSIYI